MRPLCTPRECAVASRSAAGTGGCPRFARAASSAPKLTGRPIDSVRTVSMTMLACCPWWSRNDT